MGELENIGAAFGTKNGRPVCEFTNLDKGGTVTVAFENFESVLAFFESGVAWAKGKLSD